MFVIKVEARTSRAEDVRRQVLTWPSDVGVLASGWLGITSGVSAAGEWIFLNRFLSQEAAWTTSDLPEYGTWWKACRRYLDGSPDFLESTNVLGILGGGSDAAGSVMIIDGTASHSVVRDGLRRLESLAKQEQTGLMGGIVSLHDRKRFTEVLYLSDNAASVAQRRTPSPPLSEHIDDLVTSVVKGRAVTLSEAWMSSPGVPRMGRIP